MRVILLVISLLFLNNVFALKKCSFGISTGVNNPVYTQNIIVYEGIKEADDSKDSIIAISISATEKNLPELRKFTNLQFIYLDNTFTTNSFYLSINQLEAFFSILGDLPNLHYISIYDSKLLTYFDKLVSLHGIAIENCDWNIFQQKIRLFKSLKILKIKDNLLYQLPSIIDQLTSLEQLEIEANNLNNLPNLTRLQLLQVLIMKIGAVKLLPQTFSLLENLKYLSVKGLTNFEYFPIEITNLTNLEELHLELRNGKPIPSEIEKLQKLKKLYLYDCQRIDSFPKSIKNLKELEYIYLSDTRPSFSISNLNLLQTKYTLVLNRCQYVQIAKDLTNEKNISMIILPSDILPSELTKIKKTLPNTKIEIKQLN